MACTTLIHQLGPGQSRLWIVEVSAREKGVQHMLRASVSDDTQSIRTGQGRPKATAEAVSNMLAGSRPAAYLWLDRRKGPAIHPRLSCVLLF